MYIADGGPGRTFFPISRGHESKRLKGWHGWSGRAHGIAECFPGERLKQQIHGDILVSWITVVFLYIYRMEYLGILLLSHGQKLEIKEYLRNFGFQFPVSSCKRNHFTGDRYHCCKYATLQTIPSPTLRCRLWGSRQFDYRYDVSGIPRWHSWHRIVKADTLTI